MKILVIFTWAELTRLVFAGVTSLQKAIGPVGWGTMIVPVSAAITRERAATCFFCLVRVAFRIRFILLGLT